METPFHKPVVCPVLIDRVHDLATLHALIDRAKSGTGQVVLLSGEAGIGKSRLVAEVKTYAASHDIQLLAQLDRERLAQEISLARLARDEVEAITYYQELVDAGIQYFIVQTLDAADEDSIRLLAEQVMPAIKK